MLKYVNENDNFLSKIVLYFGMERNKPHKRKEQKMKAAFHNLGCKVNAYETQSMEQMFAEAGYEIVDFEKEPADIYIINTCSVTNIADRKSRQMLHRARKQNPDAVVVAAGCYVQASADEIFEDDAVDILIGNNRKADIVAVVEEYLKEKKKSRNVIDIAKTTEYENLSVDTIYEQTRAYIKIQDGCSQFCTYCIIPYTRGRIRSRKPEAVLCEVRRLAANGYREVVLTGIHLSSYGKDFGEQDYSLIELIEAVNDVGGIERIRLGSLEPGIVTEEFVRRLAALEKICPHFHLSLQSGCDATLKRMNRRYTAKEYEQGCGILRKQFEHPAITTDVIVGFPGETEEEFGITKEFLERICFYELHVFKYSRRKGTPADQMPGQVPDSIKGKRSNELISLGEKMSGQYREKLIETKTSVLFEEKIFINGEEYFVGHTKTYVKVAVKSGNDLRNCIHNVKIRQCLTDGIMLGQIS